jgi:hypothetical protein
MNNAPVMPDTQPAAPVTDDAALEQSFRDLDAGKFEPGDTNKPATSDSGNVPKSNPPTEQPGEDKTADERPKPAKADEPAVAPKPPEKAADKTGKPQEPKPAEPEPPKQKRPWEIVREKEKEIAGLNEKYNRVEKELNELKSRPATPANDPEKERLSKRLNELEDEIRYVNYEKSTEFIEKHHKPYLEFAGNVAAEAMELIVEDGNGGGRQLTRNEFWDIVGKPTVNEAIMAARALFPDDPTKANHVLSMRKDIKLAWNKIEQVKHEFKLKGAEREKEMLIKRQQEEAKQAEAVKQKAEKWRTLNDAAVKNERLKDFFVAAEDDPKGKELLTKGFKEADLAFNQGQPVDGEGEPMKEDDLIELWSGVRNKAGAFNYVAYRYRLANSRIAELEKELAEFKTSEPKGGALPAGGEPEIDPTEAALRELDK